MRVLPLLMRTLLVSLAMTGLAIAAEEQAVDRIGVPGPVVFDGKHGRKGVILFALSRRAYNDDIDGFLKGLRSLRVGFINKVAQYTLPVVATSARP
jgi:hypothetical protein